MDLRDKIADLVYRYWDEDDQPSETDFLDGAKRLADIILAIPEIKIALAYHPRQAGYRNIVTKDGGTQFVDCDSNSHSKSRDV